MSSAYPVSNEFARKCHIDEARYQAMYEQSINSPDDFWMEQANLFLDWFQPWTQVSSADFFNGHIEWFKDGKLNACYNCIDRHLPERKEQIAIIWEGDDPNDDKHISYQELHHHVCRLANALKVRGIKKGQRVCIYMPMIPETVYAMLACARIGAIHNVVFGGFSSNSLRDRILDSDCRALITADEGIRGGLRVPLKTNADTALASCPNVHTVLTVKRTGADVPWDPNRDVWYHELVDAQTTENDAEIMDSEDPLFILYTSGSTENPKAYSMEQLVIYCTQR